MGVLPMIHLNYYICMTDGAIVNINAPRDGLRKIRLLQRATPRNASMLRDPTRCCSATTGLGDGRCVGAHLHCLFTTRGGETFSAAHPGFRGSVRIVDIQKILDLDHTWGAFSDAACRVDLIRRGHQTPQINHPMYSLYGNRVRTPEFRTLCEPRAHLRGDLRVARTFAKTTCAEGGASGRDQHADTQCCHAQRRTQ